MPTDIGFEQKFGQLVDAQINEKLPSLVDYRVGFQVIDKDEDETRAVGIAAFVLNNVWLYIPVFFLKGDLKGFGLLYIKQKDIFVPAQDNWIATLSEQGVSTLGMGSSPSGTRNNDGYDMFSRPEDTNIYQSNSASGFGKSASFDDNSLISEDTWNRMLRATMPDGYRKPDLMTDLPLFGKNAAQTFVNTFLKEPDFANALFTFYDMDQIQKLANDSVELCGKNPSVKEKPVTFISDMRSKEAQELDDPEKQLLVEQGLYVKDDRSNHSKIYHDKIDSSILQNPTHPGIYDVFMQDGGYKTMIGLLPICLSESSSIFRSSSSNVGRDVALIDINEPKYYTKVKSTEIHVKPSVKVSKSEVKGIQGGRKASLRTLRDIPEYTSLLFVQSPQCSYETRISMRKKTGDGDMYITVVNSAGNNQAHYLPESATEVRVEFTDQGELRVEGGTMFVPEGTRVFQQVPYDKKRKEWAFGKPETIYQIMHKQAGLVRMEVFQDGDLTSIKTARSNGSTTSMAKEAALRHLVLDHGIHAGQAQNMLRDTQRSDTNHTSWLVKHAAPYDRRAYGDSEAPYMGGPSGRDEQAVTQTYNASTGKKLTGAKGPDNQNLMPSDAVQKAMQAAETGIKEVFDTSVLSALLDKSDISELRKDYLTDMIKGMDKIGRMLFLFYWHNDEFEERYGAEDMAKLEDTLEEVFQSTGDLVLFLKEKTAYSPDSAESLFGSLSEDVAQA